MSVDDSPSSGLSALKDIEQALQQSKLPPVNEWHPERESTIDIRICRDGSWLYRGSPIQREAMVRLFSTVLRRDADSRYYLVTPVEKLAITVDDAPFVATSVESLPATVATQDLPLPPDETAAATQTLVFTTNVGDRVIADQQHPISVSYEQIADSSQPAVSSASVSDEVALAQQAEPSPYILVRDQLPALISRSVWYELAELCVKRGDELGVHSAGMFFALWKGSIE